MLLYTGGCGGTAATAPGPHPPTPPPSPFGNKIQHVVVIFQENNTPDNLFHGLPNADIANAGVNSPGQTITLAPITLANAYDLSRAHSAFVKQYDGAKMDGAGLVPISCKAGATGPPANPRLMHVNRSEVSPISSWRRNIRLATGCFKRTRAQASRAPIPPAARRNDSNQRPFRKWYNFAAFARCRSGMVARRCAERVEIELQRPARGLASPRRSAGHFRSLMWQR